MRPPTLDGVLEVVLALTRELVEQHIERAALDGDIPRAALPDAVDLIMAHPATLARARRDAAAAFADMARTAPR